VFIFKKAGQGHSAPASVTGFDADYLAAPY
jgi:hypothetical protein